MDLKLPLGIPIFYQVKKKIPLILMGLLPLYFLPHIPKGFLSLESL